MNFSIVQLYDEDRTAIRDHLLRLSTEDRHLRFFATLADSAVVHYAMNVIDLENGRAFGALDGSGRLVGLAHASKVRTINGRTECEVAFSIDADVRNMGLSKLLMAQVLIYCQNNSVQKLCMSCLRENKRMQALARSFGLTMKMEFQEAYAELKFPPTGE